MKKLMAIVMAALMIMTCMVGCGKEEEKTVVVGYTIYEPMNYEDENGNVKKVKISARALKSGKIERA